MSPPDRGTGRSGPAGLPAASAGADVKWLRPDRPAHLPPPMSASQATERSERANALIVIALTLACSGLAIFDLFLLAAGA